MREVSVDETMMFTLLTLQVNRGFITLRTRIPVTNKAKKLSKVETLRQAATYIKYLQEVLGYTPSAEQQSRFDHFDMKRE